MKITKKITSIVLALLLAVSAFAGLAITANAAYPTGDVTLTIHKYQMADTVDNNGGSSNVIGNGATVDAQAPTGLKGVDGVEFTLYKIGDMKTPVPGAGQLDQDGKYTGAKTQVGTATTTNGVATFTVAPANFGLYYVEETKAPDAVTEMSKPFFVYLPSTNAAGTDWLTNVDVYPKNLITLGAGYLTKTFGGQSVSAGNITFAANGAPVFKFFEKATEKNDWTADRELATIIITGNDATEIQNIALTATDDRYKGTSTANNDGVKINEYKGVITVNNLPVGEYYFQETTGATLADGTVYGQNSTKKEIIVAEQSIGEVVLSKNNDDSTAVVTPTGTFTTLTLENSSTPTITKSVANNNPEVLINPDDNAKTVTGSTFEIGKAFKYTLTPTVPTDIKDYKAYAVEDKLDAKLNYEGSVVVKSNGTTLEENNDYTVTAPSADNENKLTVAFNTSSFANLEDELTIEFKASIKSTAVVKTGIKNTAKVTWTNPSNQPGSKDSDPVYVGVLGLQVVKTDASTNAALGGAEFELYEDSTSATPLKFTLTDGVYVLDADGSATLTSAATTGVIKVKGLEKKSYVLKETKAPDNYQLLTAPLTVTVDKDSFADIADLRATNARIIKNVQQPNLPLTGGMGTILFTVAGLALIGGSAFFFIRSRKSRKEEI